MPKRIMHKKARILLLRIGKISCNKTVQRLYTVAYMVTSNKPTEQIALAITISIKACKYQIMLNRSNAAMTEQAKLRQCIRKLWFVCSCCCVVVTQCYQQTLPLEEHN